MALNNVKRREYTMEVDQYNNPGVLENDDAVMALISRLMVLEPGSDPLHPDMGVGIRNYRFTNTEQGLSELKTKISTQLQTYLPDFSATEISLKVNEDHTLTVDIYIGETIYSWNSNVDYGPSTLDDIIYG